MRTSTVIPLLALAVCFFPTLCAAVGRVIYVDADADATPDNDGSSWQDAYNCLQRGLDNARSGDEIRVAQGVYRPSTTGNREGTFQLKNNVVIRGGYAGLGAPDPDARDIEAYETILSGDLDGDDGPDFANNGENSFYVVKGSGTDRSAEMDGFTISGGNAGPGARARERHGGGMDNVEGSPKIVHCTFSGNYAENNGGGMYNQQGNPVLIGCRFIANSANYGGGIYNEKSCPVLTNCVFIDNLAEGGGGMYNNDNSNSELLSCLFVGNLATYEGGGIFNNLSNANLTNCIFSGNMASNGGGMLNDNSSPTLTNCTFSRNAADKGGGTYNADSDPRLTNCILWGNSDNSWNIELAQIYMSSATVTVEYCCVQGWRVDGLGERNYGWDPLFKDADGADNVPGTEDDDLRLSPSSPCIDAGDNTAIPADAADIDADGDATEPIPWDFERKARFIDDPHTNDTGRGIPPIVDMGALEFSRPPGLGQIVYVDVDASGANNGTSWSNAFTNLQEALKFSAAWPHVRQICVAKGVYTPAEPNGLRDDSFQLESNIAIRGGYAGCGEPDPNAPDRYLDPHTRDIDLYETVLSGDLNGDDSNMADPCDYLNDPNRVENSYHVVTAARTDASAILDGFTISGGTANGAHYRAGGGMHIMRGNPTIEECTFKGNAAEDKGGGIHCYKSDPSIRNCTVQRNFAQYGGGISCDSQSSPSIMDNQIEGNRAGNHGGGIYCENSSEPSILRNTIRENTAFDGGGIYCSKSDPNILNNMIVENSAEDDGGGICCEEGSNPLIRNNTIVRNTANPQGGGVFSEDSEPVITNCIIWDNGDDLHNYTSGVDCNATYCCIEDGTEGLGNIALAPYLVDPDNGDYHLELYSPCIDRGDRSLVPSEEVDFDGDPRIYDPVTVPGCVDIGADETSVSISDADRDVDYDYMPDEWERLHFGETSTGPNDDPDDDGFRNLQEYERGTDPHRAHEGRKELVFVSSANAHDPAADGTREHPFSRIQQAINAAQDGAHIWVTTGMYYERLTIDGKVLYIQGSYDLNFSPIRGERSTMLSTERQGRALLYVNVPDGSLSGFTICNCYERDGAGIYLFNSSPTITDNTIIYNESEDDGGGISCYFGAKPFLVNNWICNNYSHGNAGGIYCRNVAPTILNCTIMGNEAEDGGGIRLRNSTPLISGCTIMANRARDEGGGIVCRQQSAPIIHDCDITWNTAKKNGGGVNIIEHSSVTISDCSVSGNDLMGDNISNDAPDGIWVDSGRVEIEGIVNVASNDWFGRHLELAGNDGTVEIGSDVALHFDDSRICCNVRGPGTIRVDFGSELIIEQNAVVDLGHKTDSNGQVISDGLLRLRDHAQIRNARVSVRRASFEDDAIIANCVINAEAGAPYGQFFIEDNVQIGLDRIEADGDRYLDLDPRDFDCNNIHVGVIDVNITEGVGAAYGGLFELRGRELEVPPCDPGQFFCQVEAAPDFDPSTWTIDRLKLAEGAKLNLTNRFDFQAPYDSGGDREVLYVKQLILGADSILNTAFNRLYYENLTMDPTAQVINVPLLGFSLNNISFDDENDFLTRVKHNNYEHPEDPAYDRIHVERVEKLDPDPCGMMRMSNLRDANPDSPTRGQTIRARAKGLFAKSSEDEILIQFEYVFSTSDPNVELAVYLTDTPELLPHNDENRADHYTEVACLPAPPAGRPGSAGADCFGLFKQYVWRDELDFVRGTRIELELRGPAGSCVLINNWDPRIVDCNSYCCGDVDADDAVTLVDYYMMLGHVGCRAGLGAEGDTTCLDFGFGKDGRVDTLDVGALSWMLGLPRPLNLCGEPIMPGPEAVGDTTGAVVTDFGSIPPGALADSMDAFLLMGKPHLVDSTRLEDHLCVLDAEGMPRSFDADLGSMNGKLIKGPDEEIYLVNYADGVVRLGDGKVIVTPARFDIESDPRFETPAKVHVGLTQESVYVGDWVEDCWVGRPIVDAVFDAAGDLYVVPVVVQPDIDKVSDDVNQSYEMAAKLRLLEAADPPYKLVQLYGHHPPPGDNQYLNNMRAIDRDTKGNLYVLNANRINSSDILWVFEVETGELEATVELASFLGDDKGAAAMHVSRGRNELYLAPALDDPEADTSIVHVLSTNSMGMVRSIEVRGMGHITDITEDDSTGTLWVTGFTMENIPEYIDLSAEPFYRPCLAKVPGGRSSSDNITVQAFCLWDGDWISHKDIALPTAILWTGPRALVKFARFASRWRATDCASSDWCSGADLDHDGTVTMLDLALFCDTWLPTNP